MEEIPISSLSDRERKSFANAKVAMERGNFEYAIEICSNLLAQRPECLDARKLLRSAQQNLFATSKRGLERFIHQLGGWFVSLGGRLWLKRKPTRSMEIGERVLRKDPYHVSALSLIAHAGGRMGLHETEAFCLGSICERYPENADVLERLCEALIKVGDTDQSLAIAERLSSLRPNSGRVQELVKSASVAHSINKGKWAEEEQDFRSKLKDRDESERLERASRMMMDDSEKMTRIQDIISSIHQDPQNLDNYKLLIKAYVAREDYDNALGWLDKAFTLPQADSDAILRQFRSELKISSLEQEIFALKTEKSRETSDSKEIDDRLVELESTLQDFKLTETKTLVEQFPNDFTQRFKYGELLLNSGDVDTAIQQFQVSQRSPSLKLQSLFNLGKCFIQKGLFDLALQQLESANESLSTMDDFKKEILYLTAECLERLDRRDEAIDRYKAIYASDIGFRDVADKVDAFYRGEGI